MAEDYISFDEALKVLRMEEAQLRALVSQGKLRAFRDENTLKFRRQDIENLAAQRGTQQAPEDLGETAVPEVAPPAPEEPADLLADTSLDFDDTAETIIGGSEPALAPAESETKTEEPSTKVPTIELTPPETSTEETEVPTLDLSSEEISDASETEVPTMVLGLDEYDDTHVATEDVVTEEVGLEPGELPELEPATEELGLAKEGAGEAVGAAEEAPAAEEELRVGRVTPPSSVGTGEPLAVREVPSALYTTMSALAAFLLLVPGGMFFYALISRQVPDFLRPVVEFFWTQFKLPPLP